MNSSQQSANPPRRVVRTNLANRQTRQPVNNLPQTAKIKSAICFLCLFDGLRTPNIRRLIRKPRTICGKPLLTFDPSFEAPSSNVAIDELYKQAINCPTNVSIDPTITTVQHLLHVQGSPIPPQRLLIHYYGHGCHEPQDDSIYFFTDDHAKCRPWKLVNLINSCSCPLCFIFDCPNAGSLYQSLSTRGNVFAFFSCAKGEKLPLSTQAPMDLFSSCLLSPYNTAVWWYSQKHCTVTDKNDIPSQYHIAFLNSLLASILEAIAFDTQPQSIFEAYNADPSLASLFRGYVLAQRILLSFNIHPCSIPDLKQMSSHVFWGIWDIAFDACITTPVEKAENTVFKLFINTFNAYPSEGGIPLFEFFLSSSDFHIDAASHLFTYMDTVEGIAERAGKTNIPTLITDVMEPSSIALIILAKMIAANEKSPFDSVFNMYFTQNFDYEVIAAGMLAVCCAAYISWQPQFHKLAPLSIEHANNCAPFSALLYGIIMEKALKLIGKQPFESNFMPLLNDSREDVRASGIYALGYGHGQETVKRVFDFVQDESYIVRVQVLFAIVQLSTTNPIDPKFVESLSVLQNDPNPRVKEYYNDLKQVIITRRMAPIPSNPLFPHLLLSVKSVGFEERYESNIFDVEMPKKQPPPTNTMKRDIGLISLASRTT